MLPAFNHDEVIMNLNRLLAPAVSASSAGGLRLWDYTMFGVVVAH